MRQILRVLLVPFAALSLGAGAATVTAVVESAPPADAAYVFNIGIPMTDTESHCQKLNDGNPKCYTWINTAGGARRGSDVEYYSEASHGFVAILCSSAKYHGARSGDAYNFDYDGARVVLGHFHWVMVTNNGYCWQPSPNGGAWPGTPWPALPNRQPL